MKKLFVILMLSSCAPGIRKDLTLADRKARLEQRKEDKQVATWFVILAGVSLYWSLSSK